MKKRIKRKRERLKNMRTHNSLLSKISNHFKVTRAFFINEYCLSHIGEAAICHFQLKETPEWVYGIWLTNEGIKIFGEHIWLVDKFKPSRSYFNFSEVELFISLVHQIAEYPRLYFADTYTGDALVDFKVTYIGGNPDAPIYKGYQVVRNKIVKEGFSRNENITQEYFVEEVYTKYLNSQPKDRFKTVYDLDLFPNLKSKMSNGRIKKQGFN